MTGHWVTGVEAVLAPGEIASFGGPIRKDVAGYDLRGLLVGSEGTLGVVTGAWLRLIPAPEAQLTVAAVYADVEAGAAAIERAFACGVVPAAIEFLDAGALAAAARSFPHAIPAHSTFMVLVEADGSAAEARAAQGELVEALEEDALWRWRDGVSFAVTAVRGGKVSEDIVVPVECLPEAVVEVTAIGKPPGIPTCSWGHAGDGNLHATFLVDLDDPDELRRAEAAAHDLFALTRALEGAFPASTASASPRSASSSSSGAPPA